MKTLKRTLCLVLCLCTVLSLLTISASAAKVNRVNLAITAPEVGKAADYAATIVGAASTEVAGVSWSDLDPSDPIFQMGKSYTVTIKVKIKASSSNTFDKYFFINAYLNGEKATVKNGNDSEITVQYTWEGLGADKFYLRHQSLRASADPYTTAEADALWVDKQAYDTLILNQTTLPEPLFNDGYMASEIIDEDLTKDYVTGLLMDFSLDLFANEEQQENFVLALTGSQYPNLKEIWLGDKVDAVWFMKALKESTQGRYHGGETWYWTHSGSFNTGDATLYISSAAAEAVRAAYDDEIRLGNISPCFSIKVYNGDVYTAQKAGGAAAKDYCTNHKYTKVIMATDRVAHLGDCTAGLRWYYSCAICGKCEYNDNHTISRYYSYSQEVPKAGHNYELRLATEEAYVGVNANGDQIYWSSCTYCGKPYNYHQEHLTQEDYKNSGSVDRTFEQWKADALSDLATREAKALAADNTEVGMFALSAKSDAKMSTWAQSDVNHAADNNLLDTALLGNDFTKSITRLQFCSVAVRLAEELTGKELPASPANTFTDTNNIYVLKAHKAGIVNGRTATTFDPNGTLDREQMATFIYRTLMYVKDNSDYGYTAYDSKLADYTDSGKISSWAKESFEFMNALDLIKGTTATTLNPKGACTIEQAVALAARSVYAHQIGWYQATESVDVGLTTLDKGERIWVTGNRMGTGTYDPYLDYNYGEFSGYSCHFPVVDPVTGENCFVEATKLKPIRD